MSFNGYYGIKEYYLIKDNNIYKFEIIKTKNDITIKCRNYIIQLKYNNLIELLKPNFKSIEDGYEFIINIFEDNKIIIKDIIPKELIKLSLNIDNNEKNNAYINLLYNKNLNINEIDIYFNEIRNEITNIKEELKIIKNEMHRFNIKENNGNNNKDKDKNKLKNGKDEEVVDIDYKSNKNKIGYICELTKDSYGFSNLDNIFTVFESINNILYLIYTNRYNSIIAFDIIYNKKIITINNAHNELITSYRHYLDEINKRDLVLSLSNNDSNIKIWNINNWQCILNIENINKNCDLYSACFLKDNNKNFIITSHYNWNGESEPIKVFDFNGNKIKEINDSKDKTLLIDSFYDKKNEIIYIITCNEGYIKSYDYYKNKVFNIYSDNNNSEHHDSISIKFSEKLIYLIESCNDGNIRIWDFYSSSLLKKIFISQYHLYGLCLLNNDYLMVGCEDKTIKIIELKNGKIISSSIGHNNKVIEIKKIIHPKYGECFISQGLAHDQIKLWITIN